jgi:hypothetical protein
VRRTGESVEEALASAPVSGAIPRSASSILALPACRYRVGRGCPNIFIPHSRYVDSKVKVC